MTIFQSNCRYLGLTYFARRSICLALLLSACARQEQPPDDVLAVVGVKFITVDDFVQRAEMTPRPPVARVNGHTGNRALLELLIGEKLMAVRAEEQGFDKREDYQEQIKFIESQAALRELYMDEVMKETEVSEDEILRAYELMNRALELKFYSSRRQHEAEQFHRMVDELGSFAAAMQFTTGHEISKERYTAQLRWGEVDGALEDVVYNMKFHEISPVIKTERGYFVVQLENIISNALPTESDFMKKRSGIIKTLKARKAKLQSLQYVREIMSARNVVIKGPVFAALYRELERNIAFTQDSLTVAETAIPEAIAAAPVSTFNTDWWNAPLVTYQDGSMTLGEVVTELRRRSTPLDRRSPQKLRHSLRRDLFALARDKLLTKEAYSRSLQQRESVKNDCRVWGDYFLYRLQLGELKPPQQQPHVIEFSEELSALRQQVPTSIDTARLQTIRLNDISLLAVRPGQWSQFVVPPWPTVF